MRADAAGRDPVVKQTELYEYINGFKSSSDRALYVVFVNTAVSLLILVATWNTLPWSWNRQFLKTTEERVAAEYKAAAGKQTAALEALEEKRRLALRNILFVPVPGLGVNVHVNDVGLVGGVVLAFLSLLLCFVMVREHENLYLALFKVGRLCEQEPDAHADGESMANFLYHALAMGQVLNYPPTLARWRYGWRNRIAATARWAVLLLPMLVHFLVVAINFRTIQIAKIAWDEKVWFRMGLQVLFFGLTAFFCLTAAFYLRASNIRWRAAFDMVNPGLRYVSQRRWRQWIRFPFVHEPTPRHLHATLRELTFTFQPADDSAPLECIGKGSVAMEEEEPFLDQKRLLEMAEAVYQDANSRIPLAGKVVSCETIENVRRDGQWIVEMRYHYRGQRPAEVVTDPTTNVALAEERVLQHGAPKED